MWAARWNGPDFLEGIIEILFEQRSDLLCFGIVCFCNSPETARRVLHESSVHFRPEAAPAAFRVVRKQIRLSGSTEAIAHTIERERLEGPRTEPLIVRDREGNIRCAGERSLYCRAESCKDLDGVRRRFSKKSALSMPEIKYSVDGGQCLSRSNLCQVSH